MNRWTPLVLPMLLTGACADLDDDHDHDHEHGATTSVELTFTDAAGTDTTFAWFDNDGAPEGDTVELEEGVAYDLTVAFYNDEVDPREDVTEEIEEADDEHQLFFVGDDIESDATAANKDALASFGFVDTDANGLPLGLEQDVDALAAGTGTFQLVLRHMPPEDDVATKVDGLYDTVATEGVSALPGGSDVDVTWDLTVSAAKKTK